jgi:hypothetical protein
VVVAVYRTLDGMADATIAFLAAVLAAIKEEAVLEAHGSTVVETETVEPIVVILDLKAAAVEALRRAEQGVTTAKEVTSAVIALHQAAAVTMVGR